MSKKRNLFHERNKWRSSDVNKMSGECTQSTSRDNHGEKEYQFDYHRNGHKKRKHRKYFGSCEKRYQNNYEQKNNSNHNYYNNGKRSHNSDNQYSKHKKCQDDKHPSNNEFTEQVINSSRYFDDDPLLPADRFFPRSFLESCKTQLTNSTDQIEGVDQFNENLSIVEPPNAPTESTSDEPKSNDLENVDLSSIARTEKSFDESATSDQGKCERKIPQLSLVPISSLVKKELLTEELISFNQENSLDISKQKNTSVNEDLNSRNTRNPEKLIQKLLCRVCTMDKTELKNIINDPESRFDIALKIHARKKLREEIRKQLRNMNLTANNINDDTTNPNDSFFEPVESIDCVQISESVLNEISKSLGIDLLTDAGLHDDNYLADLDSENILNTEDLLAVQEQTVNQQQPDIETPNSMGAIKTPDLMTRIKNVETMKSTSEKILKQPSQDNIEFQTSTGNEDSKGKCSEGSKTITFNTSSCTISSDSADCSSDPESSSGSCTSPTGNSNKIRRSPLAIKNARMKRALEGNVITHFTTLVLPIMPNVEREKFEKKTFKTDKETLLYILDYCLKKSEDDITLTTQRKRFLKNNLKSKSNEGVLQFLMQKIKEIFEKVKTRRKKSLTRVAVNSKGQNETPKRSGRTKNDDKQEVLQYTELLNEKSVSAISLCDSPTKKIQPIKFKHGARTPFKLNEPPTSPKTLKNTSMYYLKNVDATDVLSNANTIPQIKNNPLIASNNNNQTQKSNNSKKVIPITVAVLPEKKNSPSAIFTDDNNEQEECNTKETVQSKFNDNDECDDVTRKETVAAQLNENRINGSESENSIYLETCSSRSDDCTVMNVPHIEGNLNSNVTSQGSFIHTENTENNHNKNTISISESLSNQFHCFEESNEVNKAQQRSWKSPGEKKCIELSNSSNQKTTESSNHQSSTDQPINPAANTDYIFDSNFPHFSESLKIISSIQQNKISDAVLNNLKEIDLKLMELHKRKMYIEEMILKLQKDKMSLDLSAMQLQHEKFVIINAVLAGNGSCSVVEHLMPPFNIKSEPMVTSGFSATDFMSDMLSAAQSTTTWSSSSRKRNIPSNEPSSISKKQTKQCPSKCELGLSRIKESVQKLPLKKSNFSKNIHTSDDLPSKLNNPTKENPLIEEQKQESLCNEDISQAALKTSASKIDQSSENSYSSSHRQHTVSRDLSPEIQVPSNKSIVSRTEDISEDVENESSVEIEFCEQTVNKNMKNVKNGVFENSKFPITQIRIIGDFVIAASEDGNICKFSLKTRKLLEKFSKHTEAVTAICIDNNNFIYSTSLDGYLKKTSIENFGPELLSKNLQEPLQSIDLKWNTAFIGSRWGNVFTYNLKTGKLSETLLCSLGSAIMALKATKEGPRKILIVSSKGNQINFRDATSGLLLRTIQIPCNLNIYSILQDGDLLYCGSNKNEIHTFCFTTGAKFEIFICGNGAISMKLYKQKFIFVGCYDGFVYVLDKMTGSQIGRFPGAGKMLLALDIVGEKLITSSKDNCMRMRDIPKYISALIK